MSVLSDWEPVAQPGLAGQFDEAGLSLSHVRVVEDGFECLTFGWRLRKGGGWFNEIGSLILDLGGHVRERSQAPQMSRGDLDPISMAYPMRAANDSIYYCAPSRLNETTGAPADFRILVAQGGHDGVRRVVMDPEQLSFQGIHAFTRPWQAEVAGRSHIWFSMRGEKYRVVRVDESSIGDSLSNLDLIPELTGIENIEESGSACYSSIFNWNSNLVMLYNGDGYGQSGFGVAVQRMSEFK